MPELDRIHSHRNLLAVTRGVCEHNFGHLVNFSFKDNIYLYLCVVRIAIRRSCSGCPPHFCHWCGAQVDARQWPTGEENAKVSASLKASIFVKSWSLCLCHLAGVVIDLCYYEKYVCHGHTCLQFELPRAHVLLPWAWRAYMTVNLYMRWIDNRVLEGMHHQHATYHLCLWLTHRSWVRIMVRMSMNSETSE